MSRADPPGAGALPKPPPVRALLVLTVVVVVAHVLLLRALPGFTGLDEPLATRHFITRSIESRPVQPQARQVATSPARPVTRPAPEEGVPPRAAPAEDASARVSSAAETAVTAPSPELKSSNAQPASTPIAAAPPAALAAPPATPAPVEVSRPVVAIHAESGSSAAGQGPVVIPGSARLTYRLGGEYRGQAQSGSGELLWRHDGQGYEARMTVGNLFRSRVQTSQGSLGLSGLVPTRFADRTGSERAAHFVGRGPDGHGGQVVFSANSPSVPLVPGVQDRLSVLLQMSAMMSGDASLRTQGRQLTLQVVGAREADVWSFTVEGEERLELGVGPLQTLKMTRNPRREYDQKVELWLGSSMGYLPVRLRITEPNGNFLDQQLIAMELP